MHKNEKKYPIRTSFIALFLISMGAGMIFYSNGDKEQALIQELDKQTIIAYEKEKSLNTLTNNVKEKGELVDRKIAIISSLDKLLSQNSNEWSIIFAAHFNSFKTVDLYGYARSNESKQHILSLISQIPEIYVIRENIVISPERKWLDTPTDFGQYDSSKHTIRDDVKILSYDEKEFLEIQKSSEMTYLEEKKKNTDIKSKIDSEMFNDPLLYNEITDIEVSVIEFVAEVSGILSTEAHRERINTILNKYKERGEIYTYVNHTTLQGDNSKDRKIDNFSHYLSLLRSEAKNENDVEASKNIEILENLIQFSIDEESKFKNQTTEELLEQIPLSIDGFEKQNKEDAELQSKFDKIENLKEKIHLEMTNKQDVQLSKEIIEEIKTINNEINKQ